MQRFLPLLATIGLRLCCVIADYLLKRSGESDRPFRTRAFVFGTVLYTLSTFGWVYVFRHAKLVTIGALYGVIVVVMLATVGVFAFRESLSPSELLGIACAVAAITLLARFA